MVAVAPTIPEKETSYSYAPHYYHKNSNNRTMCYVVENYPLEKRGNSNDIAHGSII